MAKQNKYARHRLERLTDPNRDPSLGTIENPLPPLAPYGMIAPGDRGKNPRND